MQFDYKFTQKTDIGKIYSVNQDSVFGKSIKDFEGCSIGVFAVADGIGGHKAGEIASQIAIETVNEELLSYINKNAGTNNIPNLINSNTNNIIETLSEIMVSGIEHANQKIYDYSTTNEKEAGNLGSTITCAILLNNIAVFGNVGDSRAYILRDSVLEKITTDHSYVETLVAKGIETKEAYYTHPFRNIITRSLGNTRAIEVDTFHRIIAENDRLLLCSDGLWEVLGNKENLQKYIEIKDLQKSVEMMIDQANANGGKDNISAVMIDISPYKNN